MPSFRALIVFVSLCFVASLTLPDHARSQSSTPPQQLTLQLESREAFQANASTLYYVQGQSIIALDRKSWQRRWVFTSSQAWIPKLELDGDRVLALTWGGTLAAIRAESGRKLWSTQALTNVQKRRGYFGRGLYTQVFPSFFVFHHHLMATQGGEYTLLEKDGRLIKTVRDDPKINIFTYYRKAFEADSYYVLEKLAFIVTSLPGPSTLSSLIQIFTNNNRLDQRSNGYFSERRNFAESDIYRLQDYFLSSQNELSTGSDLTEDSEADDASTHYFFTLYKFNYIENPQVPLIRETTGFASLTSHYRNREWCGKRWCEYTETPRDYEPLGVFDGRLYFMTDMPGKRFAFFELDELQRHAADPLIANQTNTRYVQNIQYRDGRPTGWLKTPPSGVTETDIFAVGETGHYVAVSSSGALRIVDGERVIEVSQTSLLKNFIPARDLMLGDSDVIIRGDSSVSMYQGGQ